MRKDRAVSDLSEGGSRSDVRWRDLWLGALLGAIFATILIWIPARGTVNKATFGDGELYRYVAQHLTSPRSEVAPLLEPRGLSVRYGRIGLPALLWLFSLGNRAAMLWVQPLLMTLAGALAGALAILLLRGPPPTALVPFLSLAFAMSIAGGFAEGMAIALALLSVGLARQQRWILASISMSAALLTKESAFVVLASLLLWFLLQRQWKGLWMAASAVPYVAWGAVVAARYGYFPLADPWLKNKTLGTFGLALMHSLTEGGNAALAAGLHAAFALVALALFVRSRSLFSMIAVLGSIPVMATAPVVWHYVGDGFRSAVFQEVFLVLAIMAAVRGSDSKVGTRYSAGSETSPLR